MNKEDKLHLKARDIMERLNEKYNVINYFSLDEYLEEFKGMLNQFEINEIVDCLEEFDKI